MENVSKISSSLIIKRINRQTNNVTRPLHLLGRTFDSLPRRLFYDPEDVGQRLV